MKIFNKALLAGAITGAAMLSGSVTSEARPSEPLQNCDRWPQFDLHQLNDFCDRSQQNQPDNDKGGSYTS